MWDFERFQSVVGGCGGVSFRSEVGICSSSMLLFSVLRVISARYLLAVCDVGVDRPVSGICPLLN